MGYSPWGCWEAGRTEWPHFHFSLSCIGEGNGNPLQCSCLENPRDRGAWWAAVYGVAQSQTRLKWLSSSKARFSKYLRPKFLNLSSPDTLYKIIIIGAVLFFAGCIPISSDKAPVLSISSTCDNQKYLQIFSNISCGLRTNWAWLTAIVLEFTDLMFPFGTMKAIIDNMQMISMAVFQEKLIYAHQIWLSYNFYMPWIILLFFQLLKNLKTILSSKTASGHSFQFLICRIKW